MLSALLLRRGADAAVGRRVEVIRVDLLRGMAANGGTYRWFGFLEPLTSPMTPPGDFVVEVVTIYYYSGKAAGTGFSIPGEAVDLGEKK